MIILSTIIYRYTHLIVVWKAGRRCDLESRAPVSILDGLTKRYGYICVLLFRFNPVMAISVPLEFAILHEWVLGLRFQVLSFSSGAAFSK